MELKKGNIKVRTFTQNDISAKIKWINDPQNNQYLHYDLPLEYDKTLEWYMRTKEDPTRIDAVIESEGEKVGLIGLLSIDNTNRKAEFYICLSDQEVKGKGIATIASRLIIEYAFLNLKLNRIYLYTEEKNMPAQALFERLGFTKEGLLHDDLIYNNRKVNRYIYGLLK